MKSIAALFLIIVSIPSFAKVDWGQKIPGSNYTLRDLQIQRNLMNNNMQQQQQQQPQNQMNGQGVEFTGNIEVIPADVAGTGKKAYRAYVRGCGKVEIPRKSDEEMDRLTNGTSIKLKFVGGRSCEVSDWSR